ncbi:MAG: glycosyltransferase [bacterium]
MNDLDWRPLRSFSDTGRCSFISVLAARFPHQFDLTNVESQLDSIYIAGSLQDGFLARERDSHGERMLIPPDHLTERRAAQAGALRKAVEEGAKLVILAGVGIGDIGDEIRTLLGEYPNVGFLVVEQEPVRVLLAATLFDLLPLAESENVLWAVGTDAAEQMVRLCRDNYLYLIPQDRIAFLLGTIPADATEAEKYTASVASLPGLLEPDRAAFDRLVAQFTSGFGEAFTPQGLVWSYHSPRAYIHLPLLQALLRGFEERGWRTHCELAGDDFASSLRLSASIIQSVPDMYLFLNGPSAAFLTDSGIAPGAEREIGRPRIIWIVDDLSVSAPVELRTGYSFRDYVFCADKTYVDSLSHCGAKKVTFLPAAAAVSGAGNFREEWSAPISYVGSIQNMEKYMDRLSAKAKEWLRHVASRKEKDRTVSFREIIESEKPSQSIHDEVRNAAEAYHATTPKELNNPQQILEFFLYVVATYMQRKHTVELLLPLGLRVFGPESWLDVLPAKCRNRYGGFVPFENVADAYASAALSLNLHSYQCPTCLNSRDFDVIMAGGCLVGDWVEDFNGGFFTPGAEVALFRSDDELVETVRSLLSDRQRREIMKSASRTRLLREHTYAHRVDAVLSVVGSGQ